MFDLRGKGTMWVVTDPKIAEAAGLDLEMDQALYVLAKFDVVQVFQNLADQRGLDQEIDWDTLTEDQQQRCFQEAESVLGDVHTDAIEKVIAKMVDEVVQGLPGANPSPEAQEDTNDCGPPAAPKANCHWCGNPIQAGQPFIERQTVGFDPIGAIPFPAVTTFYHKEGCYDAAQAQSPGGPPG